jgi:hypothetical protein
MDGLGEIWGLIGTSLFLEGVSCFKEGAHHSMSSSGGHHREGDPSGRYLQKFCKQDSETKQLAFKKNYLVVVVAHAFNPGS